MSQLTISYHNTVPLAGVELINAEHQAKNQDERILFLFQVYRSGTPSEIMRRYEKRWPSIPLTSVRRSITNLTKNCRLYQSGVTRKGLYGRDENEWTLRE